MDIASLTAFLKVAEAGSFSQAAEHLFITQPAVSKRINLLEQQLDKKLFDRSARSVTLTEAGLALMPVAQKILNEMAEAHHVLANLSNKVSGRLSIASSHHIGIHRLPEFLRCLNNSTAMCS
jgi:DNA-binding transcriptional LysR family regulator